MAQEFTLGKWIRENKTLKTKAKFAAKIGAHPTLVSRWMGGGGISDDYQEKIKKLGYQGPWPEDEAAGGPAIYVTREEFEDVPGRLKRLEEDSRSLLPLIRLVGDLGERVKKLEKHLGLAE